MEVLAICLVLGWFVRVAFEDGIAALRGTTSPRIARQRARQEMARESGVPTIGQAAAARIATVLAPSPVGQRRRHPALEYVRTRWEDAWDELLESHHEEMRRRAEQRRARQVQEAERRRRERETTADFDADIIEAEVVEPDPPARCTICRLPADEDGPLDEFGECPACQADTRDNLADQERLADLDDEQVDRLNWWCQGCGERSRMADDPDRLCWLCRRKADTPEPGPASGPDPADTPEPEPLWTPGPVPEPTTPEPALDPDLAEKRREFFEAIAADRAAGRPTYHETPEPEQGAGQHDPEPAQVPASTTQDSTHSGSAAHLEGTPVPQATVINPNVIDASGALRCSEGALAFTRAVGHQMEVLAANVERGLRGRVPAVDAILAFRADITATASTIDALVAEHIEHVRTQAELANDPNLKTAAVGYLDSRRRA